MLHHPNFDPVALRLGPIHIQWYAIMYLIGFAGAYLLLRLRLRHQPVVSTKNPAPWRRQDLEDILLLCMIGVVVGGRLGYCLFYKPAYYAAHPLEIFYIWQGGMSFHGGLLGVLIAAWWWSRPPATSRATARAAPRTRSPTRPGRRPSRWRACRARSERAPATLTTGRRRRRRP